MDTANVNAKMITSILLILSLLFAQVGAVFAFQTPSCNMADNMQHEMSVNVNAQVEDTDKQILMDCCDKKAAFLSTDCCDNNCNCAISILSFASISNLDNAISFLPSQNAITSSIQQPLNTFLSKAQRPPIPLIS